LWRGDQREAQETSLDAMIYPYPVKFVKLCFLGELRKRESGVET
jgi:hypothetical protein